MADTDGHASGLLDDQPDGRKGPGGRLLGVGGYRRPRSNESLLARQLRIAAGRPQAILKITRYGQSGAKILGHLQYVSRRGALELEDEQGKRGHSVQEVRRRVRIWCAEAGVGMTPNPALKRQRRATMHFILDAGRYAKKEALSRAARDFLREQFCSAGHEYFFVRHDDTRQPHVHVVMTVADGRGKKLHTSVQQVQQWRERFAAISRSHGIEVDASRAWERGKAPAKSRGSMRHGAPPPPRWTREQVRRGMEARRYKILAELREAEQAGQAGNAEQCAALGKKLNRTYLRVDHKLVEHVVSESRSSGATTPWEQMRDENRTKISRTLLERADELKEKARDISGADERRLLDESAERLRAFEAKLSRSPTRSQLVAAELARSQTVPLRIEEDRQPDGAEP